MQRRANHHQNGHLSLRHRRMATQKTPLPLRGRRALGRALKPRGGLALSTPMLRVPLLGRAEAALWRLGWRSWPPRHRPRHRPRGGARQANPRARTRLESQATPSSARLRILPPSSYRRVRLPDYRRRFHQTLGSLQMNPANILINRCLTSRHRRRRRRLQLSRPEMKDKTNHFSLTSLAR